MSFRAITILLSLLIACIGLYHRIQAERSGEKVSRRAEGPVIMITLRLFGFATLLTLILYMIQPAWTNWSHMELPDGLRWIGAGISAMGIPLFFWMFRCLGKNITDTVVVRKEHNLVTTGIYRWVRHPLYSIAAMLLVGFTLLTANWFLALAGLGTIGMLVLRTKKEEELLIERYGDVYRSYMHSTGRFLPKLFK